MWRQKAANIFKQLRTNTFIPLCAYEPQIEPEFIAWAKHGYVCLCLGKVWKRTAVSRECLTVKCILTMDSYFFPSLCCIAACKAINPSGIIKFNLTLNQLYCSQKHDFSIGKIFYAKLWYTNKTTNCRILGNEWVTMASFSEVLDGYNSLLVLTRLTLFNFVLMYRVYIIHVIRDGQILYF